MGDVIAQLVPLAAVVAINPLPVIAMILVLQTPAGRRAGAAFAAAWVLALLALGFVAVLVANQTGLYGSGYDAPVARLIRGAVGVLLVAYAVTKWLGRPRDGEDAKTPGWMTRIATITTLRAARLGAILAAGNPKNIAVTLAAAAAVVEAGLRLRAEAATLLFYVAASTLGIAVPLVTVVLLGERGDQALARWGRWLTRYNAVVVAVVLLVIGLLLIVGAITG